MTPELAAIILGGTVILACLWTLHDDIVHLRERSARVEGMFVGYITRPPKAGAPESNHVA